MLSVEQVLDLAERRGWHARIHQAETIPDHQALRPLTRLYGIWGQSDRIPDTRQPRAEVGHLTIADTGLVAWTLLHELGHCEHSELVGRWGRLGYNKEDPVRRALIECDAWERCLVMLGELGEPLTPPMAEFATRALSSYGWMAAGSDTANYLLSECGE